METGCQSRTSSTPHTSYRHEVLAAASVVVVAGDDDHPYYCTSDAYCEKNYPGTVCISVNNYGDVISKCTPNTSKRPACRGAQPGLCPSYQSSDQVYLNAHCVFVSEENLSLSSSGSGSSRRCLNAAASSSGSTSTASASSASISSSQSSGSGNSTSSSSTTSSTNDADALYTATIDGEEVTGQFVCLDVSDYESKAADPSTCYPSAAPTKERARIRARRRSPSGDMCSTEVSNACDVDCGTGGDCVDGECVCKEGFDGKEYDGKQGTANERCTRCTNDLACQYNNTCNTDTGKCVCAPGYSGDTCGAVEDACTTTDCGEGDCQVLTNGSAACYCPSCSPSCTLCDMLSNYTFDCSTCPTDASMTVQTSKLLLIVSALVAVMLASLAL
ncbi:hypothetical protein PHYSODRAFT_295927 [Phytophthora sojae]|uniref:EGF-like domain-containing protein n=1 Tax=Phytophthora sojae (strain P6497) TaxID=1094619 RepID=G4YU44_PHYSP|nr:hypothetical protein PHYSODRAFT_295927 [Phytophthora sojae]EGZ23599.1 hypothetical protein PHYSODRAFT_295927 [Phytophthora sojae]|eukprot:XP_009518887.1 hypothetical protein PHYSODRAFT_295927 [Phytophthora sojae]